MGRRAFASLLLSSLFAGLTIFPRSAVLAADGFPKAGLTPVTFAIIGDYGMDNANALAVANLVASWNASFVISTGDGYYTAAGGTGTARYDESTGAYYCNWLTDITTTGTRCPVGLAPVNAFFPSMGNHDYSDATPAPSTYLDYFTLPGAGYVNSSDNERYYDFVAGPVHFFAVNTNAQEPDGNSSNSIQAQWLQQQLAASTSRWKIVYGHHPPYSSDSSHGSTATMQWPYAAWGADVVISGHAHSYERIARDGIVYFVNGLGGAARYNFTAPVAGSAVRYNANWGAQKVTASDTTLVLDFYNVNGELVDSHHLGAFAPGVQPSAASSIASTGATLNGRVSSNGAASTVMFEYGLTTGYGNSADAAQSPLAAAAANAAVSAMVNGLTCSTVYHLRTVAANDAGTTFGPDALFATAKCDQTIAFGAVPGIVVGGTGMVSAIATSGLPVILASTTPTVCTIAGSTVTGVAAGTCTIAAVQVGNAIYNPAPLLTQDFAIGKGSQAALTATAAPPGLIYNGTAAMSTTGGSGSGAVTYAVTAGPCSIAGSMLTATGVGICTITAAKAGDGNYNAALAIVQVPVSKATQVITFGTAPGVVVGGTGTVSAAATSGEIVSFTSTTPSICTIAGSTVTGADAGTCSIAADQAGNANFDAAAQVTQSFAVALAPPLLLRVTPLGFGMGIVTSNLPGIECGADCSESHPPGTSVVLFATAPFTGSAFGGWGGDCAGVGTCTLIMSTARNVTASFIYTGSAYSHDYVQLAYVAYYGRPADPPGQAYWGGRMDAEGQSLDAIIGAFGSSDEFNRRYGGLSYPTLVTKIYQQALGRDPEQGGLDFYVGELQSGRRTLQSITLDVMNGATGLDALTVTNRLDVAEHFTGKVAAGCPYGGELTGVASLASVNSDIASANAAKLAIDGRCGP